jgi:hypothetical protein
MSNSAACGARERTVRRAHSNTQVSATELRSLPLPEAEVIHRVAAEMRGVRNADDVVEEVLRTRG